LAVDIDQFLRREAEIVGGDCGVLFRGCKLILIKTKG